MLPEFISVGRLRIAAVVLFTLAWGAPVLVSRVRNQLRPRQTRRIQAGQPLLITTTADGSTLAVSKAPVGVSRQVLALLLQAAELPALDENATLGFESRAYCNALSKLEKRTACYTDDLARTVANCTGYRLPLQTELRPSQLQPLTGPLHPFNRWPSNAEATIAGPEGAGSYHVVRKAAAAELAAAAASHAPPPDTLNSSQSRN